MYFKKYFKVLVKPHYWVNIILCFSYLIAKATPIICNYLFKRKEDDRCALEKRETAILVFFAIVALTKMRQTGTVKSINNYLRPTFFYLKIANLFLWTYGEYRFGVIYLLTFIIIGLLLPEPAIDLGYVTSFRNEEHFIEEVLEYRRDMNITWLVCLYCNAHPICGKFLTMFASLADEYHLDNLRFGKINVKRHGEVAEAYEVSLERHMPTVILFQNRKGVYRWPKVDSYGNIEPSFSFTEDTVREAFRLDSLFKECKSILVKTAVKAASKEEKKQN